MAIVKYVYLDNDFKEIEVDWKIYSTVCFASILRRPHNAIYVRYLPIINVGNEQAKKFLEILFDLFPHMKACINETIDEIVEKKQATAMCDEHYSIVLSTFMGIRYLQDFPHIVLKTLEFVKDCSIEEAFEKAHDIRLYEYPNYKSETIKYPDLNSNHTLLCIRQLDQTLTWSKNFRKRFDSEILKNGSITDGRTVQVCINKVFHDDIIRVIQTIT